MTKVIPRISYDDKMKLIPIVKEFGNKTFTMRDVSTRCLPTIRSGDLCRWDRSQYVIRSGQKMLKGKSTHPVVVWKLTKMVIGKLNKELGAS